MGQGQGRCEGQLLASVVLLLQAGSVRKIPYLAALGGGVWLCLSSGEGSL